MFSFGRDGKLYSIIVFVPANLFCFLYCFLYFLLFLVNIRWKHGVNYLPEEDQQDEEKQFGGKVEYDVTVGRISIILWGNCPHIVDEEDSPPMLTDNTRGNGHSIHQNKQQNGGERSRSGRNDENRENRSRERSREREGNNRDGGYHRNQYDQGNYHENRPNFHENRHDYRDDRPRGNNSYHQVPPRSQYSDRRERDRSPVGDRNYGRDRNYNGRDSHNAPQNNHPSERQLQSSRF
jgi:hypothetical protein